MLTSHYRGKLEVVELTGSDLTIEEIINVSLNKTKVMLAPGIMNRIHHERNVLVNITKNGPPIYGVTRGVGANKNVEIPDALISEYQYRILLSHCVGVGPFYSEDIVRAIMIARANALAKGGTGVQPEILDMYINMLNHRIHPLTPSKGSIGAGDLGPMANMGLALIGEGEVIYQGKTMTSIKAMEQAGLKPIKLGPKDGLILCSNNGVSIGHAALLVYRYASMLDHANISYALSLEAFRGNVTSLHSIPNVYRPHKGQLDCTKDIVNYLENSFLWDENIQRGVQDPISYRSAIQVHGACRDIFDFTLNGMNIEINSVGDNPLLSPEETSLISHGNYHIQTIAMRFDFLGIQSSSLANMIQHRIQKLMSPGFSDLPKFLTSDPGLSNGFSTLQKTYTYLAAEIRHLANPGSLDALPVANGVEDHASMATFVIQKTEKIIENLEMMIGIELMVAAQAIDLLGTPKLGKGTNIAYASLRGIIPMLDKDRVLSQDIEKAHSLIRSGAMLNEINTREKVTSIIE
ncbi:HAL/PAL/TAL family ammonia-lyase [Sporosarcina jiandibaonis]|uniref:HAL/PAL/TAL family ammonia-lyase n=1 Tax=Sporosarcina jiandibaonis TaxID=2715535 RepID=UPI0015548F03|nr:histidine ammonia-lyase [Sporosarcina jiandibaonis]